jgi:hypothetical protein
MTDIDCQVSGALDLALRNAPELSFSASNEWHPYRATPAIDMTSHAVHLTEKGLFVYENHFGRPLQGVDPGDRPEDVNNQAGRGTMPFGHPSDCAVRVPPWRPLLVRRRPPSEDDDDRSGHGQGHHKTHGLSMMPLQVAGRAGARGS